MPITVVIGGSDARHHGNRGVGCPSPWRWRGFCHPDRCRRPCSPHPGPPGAAAALAPRPARAAPASSRPRRAGRPPYPLPGPNGCSPRPSTGSGGAPGGGGGVVKLFLPQSQFGFYHRTQPAPSRQPRGGNWFPTGQLHAPVSPGALGSRRTPRPSPARSHPRFGRVTPTALPKILLNINRWSRVPSPRRRHAASSSSSRHDPRRRR